MKQCFRTLHHTVSVGIPGAFLPMAQYPSYFIINRIKLIQTLIKIQSIIEHYMYTCGIFDTPSQMQKASLSPSFCRLC